MNYEPTDRYILEKKEYKLNLEDKDYFMIGHMSTIENKDKERNVIFLFNETETVKNQIIKIS